MCSRGCAYIDEIPWFNGKVLANVTNDFPWFVDHISGVFLLHDFIVYHLKAKEHYVRVLTSDESRMLLHRFSDAVKQMPHSKGMQVHRSHWVADASVTGLIVKGKV